ncbi:PAS domain S-box protein [Candidatus Peregrinibacteria bacterium]|jgi:PAS domain S-box-containing protein|nr:PAS domain S-box protein [Candidatus Peregrinibacteria bacterium]MBT4056330.1 PAS domain S-box protein [Candidatus Peregrinibacteria bacterium]
MNPIHSKTDSKKTNLEFLNHLYASLAEELSLEGTLKTLSKILRDYFDCRYTDFILLDDKNKDQYTIYNVLKSGEIEIHDTKVQGLTKKAIETKKAIAIEDVKKEPLYDKWRKDVKSELCVPLFSKRRVIGCINLEFIDKQTFEKDTITSLEIVGKGVGAILRNAKLHETIDKSEKKFRQLVEHMNEGLWVGDENHNTTYVNPKFAEMAGLSKEECLKKDCFDFYDEDSVQDIQANHELRTKGTSSQYELTMMNKNGDKIPLLCSGTPISGGTLGIFTNLSLLKEKEQQITELSKSERLLAYITDNSIDGIISVDRNLIIKSWNKGAEKMFGYKKEEVLGQNVRMLMPPQKIKQGELEQIVKITLEKGFLRSYESIRINKAGKDLNVALSVTKLTDEKNRFIGFGIIYRDISYQKKAEKELQSRFESMQNAYLELGRQRRQLDYLLDTLNIAIGDEHFPNIENYIANAAIMLTKADGATLRLFNKKDKLLHLKALSGVQAAWWGKSKVEFQNTIAERAYDTRRPIFINDLQNNPVYTSPKLAAEHGFLAALAIPLYVKNEYIGNLTLYSSDKNKLNLIDDTFIANFGKQASLALFTNKQ